MKKRHIGFEPTFYPEEFLINPLCLELVNNGTNIEVLTGQPNYPTGIPFRLQRCINSFRFIIRKLTFTECP